jgi:hypothetical protein
MTGCRPASASVVGMNTLSRLSLAAVIALALLASTAAAQTSPPSQRDPMWPREPVGAPGPVVTPAPASNHGRDWTLVSVAGGLVILAVCTAAVAGARPRRRVSA